MTRLDFAERVAIVTGAGRGIGAAVARALARRGAAIVVNDVGSSMDGTGEDAAPANAVAAEIARARGRVIVDTHSVSESSDAEAIVQAALQAFGRIDVVVHNAGIISASSFPATTPQDLDRHLGVHLIGAFNVCRAAWPHMASNRYGRIVLMSSSAIFGSVVSVSYAAAKAGQIGLLRSLCLAGNHDGIKINAIAPVAGTRMSIGPSDLAPPDSPTHPPEFVAEAVALLAHEDCPTSGEIFGVGAGTFDRIVLAATDGRHQGVSATAEQLKEGWLQILSAQPTWAPASSFAHVRALTGGAPSPTGVDTNLI